MALDEQTRLQFVKTIERFVTERLLPAENRVEEQGSVPDEILHDMAALGLFGLSIPEQWDGLGLGMEDEVAVLIALCRANLSFRCAIGINNGVGSHGLLSYGSDVQRRRYLPLLASGELIASFCLTEPENRDHNGLSAFLVERDTPGMEIGKTDQKMGLHGSSIADVSFDDCRIPAEAIIGEPRQGFALAMSALNRGRLNIAASAVGTGRRLLEEAMGYATQRRAFGAAIAQHQLMQAMLADSETELMAAQCMVEHTARRFDQRLPVIKEASCCKLFATETVGKVADRMLQIFAGAGYLCTYPIERIYRDVRVMRIYEGSSQIQQLLIAKQMLKEHANLR